MSPRLLVVLLSVVNVVAGVAIGIVVDRTVLIERRGPRGGRPDPARMLEKKLDLDADQAKKVREVFAARRPQFEACMHEVQPKLEQLRQESDNQIRALLRPEQQTKFDEMRREWQQRGHHGERERGRGEASVGSETQTRKEGVR